MKTVNFNPTFSGLSSFSGTDLSTSVTSPGICFPLGPIGEDDIKNKPSFSSIMLHDGSNTVIGRTEYRTATSPKPDEVKYEKHRCLTFICDTPTTPGLIASFLGEKPENKSYIKNDYVTQAQFEAIAIHDIFMDALNESDYTASTSFIDPDNVSKRSYTLPAFNGSTLDSLRRKSQSSNTKIPHRNSKEWKEIAVEAEDFYGVALTPYTVLMNVSLEARLEYYKEIYEAMYNTLPVVSAKSLLPTDILSLQDKMWLEAKADHVASKRMPREEYRLLEDNDEDTLLGALRTAFNTNVVIDDDTPNNETVSYQEMYFDLITWGADQKILDTATPEQIFSMWKKASTPSL